MFTMRPKHITYATPAEALQAVKDYLKAGAYAYVLQGCTVSVYS